MSEEKDPRFIRCAAVCDGTLQNIEDGWIACDKCNTRHSMRPLSADALEAFALMYPEQAKEQMRRGLGG